MAQTLRLRVMPRFLAALFSGVGTAIRKDGLASYVDIDYTQFGVPVGSIDPAANVILVYNTTTGIYNVTTLATLIAASSSEQDIAAGAVVTVAASDGMIKINKTVGSATSVVLPASTAKIGPVKIVDWKGDADVNNITISLTGTDKFNGNQTTWVISGQGASVIATPLKDGTGYAI